MEVVDGSCAPRRARIERDYHLFEVSSFSGTTWSKAVNLGDAVQNDEFTEALNTAGSGLVLGTGVGAGPAFGYPVPAS